jgi:hypothetical protein
VKLKVNFDGEKKNNPLGLFFSFFFLFPFFLSFLSFFEFFVSSLHVLYQPAIHFYQPAIHLYQVLEIRQCKIIFAVPIFTWFTNEFTRLIIDIIGFANDEYREVKCVFGDTAGSEEVRVVFYCDGWRRKMEFARDFHHDGTDVRHDEMRDEMGGGCLGIKGGIEGELKGTF